MSNEEQTPRTAWELLDAMDRANPPFSPRQLQQSSLDDIRLNAAKRELIEAWTTKLDAAEA